MRRLSCLLVLLASSLAHADADEIDLGNCEERVYAGKDPTPVRVVSYTRDAQGHPTKVTIALSGGTTLVTEYTYDAKGRKLTSRLDNLHGNYQYDDAGRLVHVVDYDDGKSTPTDTWTYTYDSAGRLDHVTQTVDSSVVIEKAYTYDRAGRIASVVIDKDTTETYHYGANGKPDRMIAVTRGKRSTFTWKYDAKGRPVERAVGDGKIVYRYDCKR